MTRARRGGEGQRAAVQGQQFFLQKVSCLPLPTTHLVEVQFLLSSALDAVLHGTLAAQAVHVYRLGLKHANRGGGRQRVGHRLFLQCRTQTVRR